MNKEKVLKWLYDSDVVHDTSQEYKEPHYNDDGKLILTGDWNKINNKFCNHLENYFNLEWCDEWITCCNCCGLVRTEPNSYSWQPSFVWINDCEIICVDCLHNDIDLYQAWLEDYVNNSDKCINNQSVNYDFMYKLGYELLDDNYYSGWHDGMTDNPVTILEKLSKYYNSVVFENNSTSQFYITFRTWVREE